MIIYCSFGWPLEDLCIVEGLGALGIKCLGEFFISTAMKRSSLSLSTALHVLAGVSDPPHEGQRASLPRQGMTTHRLPHLNELPALRQTNVSYLSDLLKIKPLKNGQDNYSHSLTLISHWKLGTKIRTGTRL